MGVYYGRQDASNLFREYGVVKVNYIFFPYEMRADSLSCYRNPVVKMPNYDRLASEGVRFDKCFVQHTVCSPSRCSLMTSWYPHVRGHRTLWNLLCKNEPSLFRYSKEHFKKIMAVYLRMNSYVDWMLGKILDALDKSDLCENTIVIVSSVHGDWAGDYGLVEK